MLGLVFVVRIDAVADLLPLVPFVGWLAYHRVARLAAASRCGSLLGLRIRRVRLPVLTCPYTEARRFRPR